MSHKVRFAVLAVVLAAAFYALLSYYATSDLALWAFGDATAVIAVMLAAQGVSLRRKALFVGITVALSILLFEVVAHSFLGSAADALTNSDLLAPTDWQLTSFVAVEVLFFAVPVAVLALFVGRRPSVLWTARKTGTATSPRKGVRRRLHSSKTSVSRPRSHDDVRHT